MMDIKEIEAEALSLPSEERASLAHRLLLSLEDISDAEFEVLAESHRSGMMFGWCFGGFGLVSTLSPPRTQRSLAAQFGQTAGNKSRPRFAPKRLGLKSAQVPIGIPLHLGQR